MVTSRRTLTGLITRHGAHHLPLDTLRENEARALLARRLGPERVAAEPAAVAELVGLCGGLPLALGIIAGRAHAQSCVPLAEFTADLRGLGLGALEDDDPATGLPTVLSWSYRALTTQQQVGVRREQVHRGQADKRRHDHGDRPRSVLQHTGVRAWRARGGPENRDLLRHQTVRRDRSIRSIQELECQKWWSDQT
jgi:hypothetical protein